MNTPTVLAGADGKNMTTFGVIAIILGILCMCAPMIAGLSITLVLGILVMAGGLLRMIWAFKAGGVGHGGILRLLLGLLTLACGLLMVVNPVFGASVLTILLSLYFIFDGIVEIAAGSSTKQGWLTFAGIVSILLGIVLWTGFPFSGPWVLGILLGLKLIFIGIIMLTGGSAVKSFAKA
jgi:uncharacterized membrane protein HdeD (DUF308 family)